MIGNHSCVIDSQNYLHVTGLNNYGQLGINNATSIKAFQKEGSRWKEVSAGPDHSVGIKEDGSLWATGSNQYGQLGDGTSTIYYTKAYKLISQDKHIKVSAGKSYSAVIKADGSLVMAGYNAYGQLGDGTTTNSKGFYGVSGGGKWKDVSCSNSYTMAIKQDGTLWATGTNSNGQFGNGTKTSSKVFVQVSSSKWKKVSVGYDHTLAIREDGTLWASGKNNYGQLGIGTKTQTTYLTQIPGNDWVEISTGSYHSAAIKKDGSLWTWGLNKEGQLGNGYADMYISPEKIIDVTECEKVSCGVNHTMIVRKNGQVLAAGSNSIGQLGLNSSGRNFYSFNSVGYFGSKTFLNDTAKKESEYNVGSLGTIDFLLEKSYDLIGVKVEYNLPTNTFAKALISKDKKTWLKYKNKEWIISEDIKNDGMELSEINSLNTKDFSFFEEEKLFLRIGMWTEDKSKSPEITKVKTVLSVIKNAAEINKLNLLYEGKSIEYPNIYVSKDSGLTWHKTNNESLLFIKDNRNKDFLVKIEVEKNIALNAIAYSWI